MSSSLRLLNEPEDLSSIEGVMEGVPHDAFSGWVWNRQDPGIELSVEIIGPGFYTRLPATEYREDLASAGKRGGNCWFKILVPGEVSNHAQVAAVALLAGTSHRIRKLREGDVTLDRDWLDEQPLSLRIAVNAQRVRSGLDQRPLSEAQIEDLVTRASEQGLGLSELVAEIAHLPA